VAAVVADTDAVDAVDADMVDAEEEGTIELIDGEEAASRSSARGVSSCIIAGNGMGLTEVEAGSLLLLLLMLLLLPLSALVNAEGMSESGL